MTSQKYSNLRKEIAEKYIERYNNMIRDEACQVRTNGARMSGFMDGFDTAFEFLSIKLTQADINELIEKRIENNCEI